MSLHASVSLSLFHVLIRIIKRHSSFNWTIEDLAYLHFLHIFICFLMQSITYFDSFSQFTHMFTIVSELLEPYLTHINKHKNTARVFAGVLKWEGLVYDYVQIYLTLAMKYKEINSISSYNLTNWIFCMVSS